MKQRFEDIENFYSIEDPWGFKSNPDDLKRKQIIIDTAKQYCQQILNKKLYDNALELGAGEGWITKDLPSKEKYGYEISSLAKSRWPQTVKEFQQQMKYDLIIAPGVLYEQYDYEKFHEIMLNNSNGIVMTISIKNWEKNYLTNPIYEIEFVYREFLENLKVYDMRNRK